MIFTETIGAVTFTVKVVPRASKNEIVGIEGDAVKVRLNAPPVDGRANVALVQLLADELGVSHAQIEIVSGETSRRKVIKVSGVKPEQLKSSLEKAL